MDEKTMTALDGLLNDNEQRAVEFADMFKLANSKEDRERLVKFGFVLVMQATECAIVIYLASYNILRDNLLKDTKNPLRSAQKIAATQKALYFSGLAVDGMITLETLFRAFDSKGLGGNVPYEFTEYVRAALRCSENAVNSLRYLKTAMKINP